MAKSPYLDLYLTAESDGEKPFLQYRKELSGPEEDSNMMKIDQAIKRISQNQYANPQMYGAVGDGVTDDTLAFLSCFNAHKYISIPPGVYRISNTITIQDGTTVRCEGTVIRHQDDSDFEKLFIVKGNADIQINIDSNRGNQTNALGDEAAEIFIEGTSSTKIENVYIHDSTFQNTNVRSVIWINYARNIRVERCSINRYRETGIGVRSGCENITICNNRITNGYGNDTMGLQQRYPIIIGTVPKAEGAIVTRGVVCDGNYIEDSEPYWEGIDSHAVEDAVISNNIIINTLTGIAIDTVGASTKNVLIQNNVYRLSLNPSVASHSCVGISVAGISDVTGVVIDGNSIMNGGNNAATDNLDKGGIKINGTRGTVISNNNISVTNGFGISAYSGQSTHQSSSYTFDEDCNDFIISGNYIRNSGDALYGVRLSILSGHSMSGTIRDCTVIGFPTGIQGPSSGQSDHLHSINARDIRFVDCETRLAQTANVVRLSPNGGIEKRSGKTGDSIMSTIPDVLLWKCLADSTDSQIATWETVSRVVCIGGTYTLDSNGEVEINDERISNALYFALASTPGNPEMVASVDCSKSKATVTVRNINGTKPSGQTIKIAVVAFRPFELGVG